MGLTAGIPAGGLAYGLGWESHWLEERRIQIFNSDLRLKTPIRLAHLSDLHASAHSSKSYLIEVAERTLALEPDAIFITGDFITGRNIDYVDTLVAPLKLLSAYAPTFASLGNHDGHYAYEAVTQGAVVGTLESCGVSTLCNRRENLTIRGQSISVVGLGDLWGREFKPEVALRLKPELKETFIPSIVLSHNPDTVELLKPYEGDLILCGHTHGGQIKLPFFGTPFVPVEDRRYIAGLYQEEERVIHVSRGVGSLHGIRFNCRPEITLIETV